MLIEYNDTEAIENYKLMAQTIIPRPIAWVVTENDGVVNVAPFSYFTGLSSNPPTMIISVGHKSDGTPKDTLYNLRKNKKCTLCMVKPEHLEMMHFSSREMQADISEAKTFDIPLENIVEGYPPMIKGAPAAFVCDLYSEVDLGQSKTIPLVIEIKHQFIDDAHISDKERLTIDFEPLARVGKSYALLGEEIAPPTI
ncbi:MAG: flavin reductase family protein [Campylobacterota bacterium]|nr:flavin reductase family protein [Campylobacterota bacterium]